MTEAGRYRAGWTRLSAGEWEEEGGSVGGRDRDGVPGAGSKLGRGGAMADGRGPRTTARWMPPCRVSEGAGAGGLFSRPPPVNCRGPVDGDGSDHGDWWQSNRSYYGTR